LMPLPCARSRVKPRMARRRGVSWRWPRSRGGKPHRGGPDRRGHGPDRAGLGGEVQRPRTRGPGQPQATWSAVQAHRCASRGLGGPGRCGPDPGGSRRGTLAVDRPDPVALGGVPPVPLPADAVARVAGHELPQALGPSAPSRQERGGSGRF
jgi:hypothetical protein